MLYPCTTALACVPPGAGLFTYARALYASAAVQTLGIANCCHCLSGMNAAALAQNAIRQVSSLLVLEG